MPIKKKKKPVAPALVAVVSRQDLKNTLGVLSIVIPSRAVRPMLEYVVLQFEPGQLTLTGTNLDVMVSARVPAKVTDRVRVLVPLREFATLVRSGADEVTLSVSVSEDVVTVQNGLGKAKLPLGDVSEYPDLTIGHWTKLGDTLVEIEAKGLAYRLEFVRRAQATNADDKRYAMFGVLLAIEGGQELAFVSTDGKRLHLTMTSLCSGVVANVTQPMLLSPVAAHALSKLLKKGDGRLSVQFPPLAVRKQDSSLYCGGHGGVACLTYGSFTILDRTVDGEFPQYQRVIPASVKTEVTVDSDAIEMALDQVVGVCAPEARAVRLSPDLDAHVVSVSAGAQHGSQAESAFGFEPGYGDKVHDFALNPDFLRDAVAGRDQVRFGWNEKNQPVRLDGTDDCLAVIMPIITP
jgi:DNA polymerase-3 subunit beta